MMELENIQRQIKGDKILNLKIESFIKDNLESPIKEIL